jgi:uncharacterized protein
MAAPATDRSTLLDALRGFALFGVAFSNYAMFAFWLFMPEQDKAALSGARFDALMGFIHGVLIDGKFYSNFSLLFGIGFGFFLAKGNDGLGRFYRRMIILLLIGWVHMRYLWEGDILFCYAALGLVLPLFRKLSDRAVVITAFALILSPVLIDSISVWTKGAFDPAAGARAMALAGDGALGVPETGINSMVPNGGLKEFNAYMNGAWWWRIEHLLATSRLPKVLGLFLIGLWVSRRKLFVDPSQHRVLLKRVCIGGAALGLPFSVLQWWSGEHLKNVPEAEGLIGTIAYALGVVPLALAYASGFVMLWTSDRWRRWLAVFAPMGRMALTNYLMQTFIGLLLFTGMGFGWGTHVSAIVFEGIAVTVFAVEVLWSHWWLKHFRFGPFEWLWRTLTYGRMMPMGISDPV